MLAWRLYALYLERQPAAVAGGVAEELHVVARAAERGDVLAVLMVVVVGRTLVDGGHGDGCLQLVQLRGAHRVELLAAHQTVLRQGQQVVASHTVGVRLRVEIVRQLGRQQVVEPRGLVRALFAYQHQDHVVHHLLIDPRRHHAHQPLLQVLGKEHLLIDAALDAHRHRHAQDIVQAVPLRQVLQVVEEGVIVGHEVRLDQTVDVVGAHLLLLRHHAPYHVHRTVVDGLPVGGVMLVARWQPVLRTTPHHVIAQQHPVLNEVLDVLYRGRVFPPVGFSFLFLFFVHRQNRLCLQSYKIKGAKTSICATTFRCSAK